MQTIAFPNLEGIDWLLHGMFTRFGGASKPPYHESNFRLDSNDDPEAVRETYRRAGKHLGFDETRLVAGKQVHEANVFPVTEADAGIFWRARPECDAFVTNLPGIPLGVFGADCQPILMVDPANRVIAAAHAGWRGTEQHIARNTVQTMQRMYGCNPKDIQVAIGPHIHSCCYQVSSEVADALGCTPILREDGIYVELSDCVARDLKSVGVPQENLYVSPICTRCQSDLFWSHRAVAGGERGVCLAVIMLKEETE